MIWFRSMMWNDPCGDLFSDAYPKNNDFVQVRALQIMFSQNAALSQNFETNFHFSVKLWSSPDIRRISSTFHVTSTP